MKRMVQILWLVMAGVLLLCPFPFYNMLRNHLDTENHENRELAEKPELDLLALESYPYSYDAWLNDHLPFRNQLIAANSLISILAFQESPSEKVIIGKDGWYFYNSAANENADTIADFQGTNLFNEAELEFIKTNMLNAKEALAEQGIEFVLFLIPNKEQMYADKMPEEYGTLTEYTRIQQVYDYLKDDLRVVYVKKDLVNARGAYPQYDLYYHLDTHWNNLGAYIGTKSFMKELDYEMPEIEQLQIESSDESVGLDLSALMNLTEYLNKDREYHLSGYSMLDTESLEMDSNTILRYRTRGADERKLVLIGDSFRLAAAPFIASQFSESVFINYAFYLTDNGCNTSLLASEMPDIVVFEAVERYIDRLGQVKFVE